MKLRALTVPIVVALGVLGSPARAGLLTERWVTTPGGTPDGAALGDLDGDGGLEIAMLVRGGSYSSPGKSPGVGALVVLNQNGSLRFQVQTGQEMVGYPVFGDFDGDSFDEVAFCELGEAAYCYAYNGDGTRMFRFGPLWHPAMTNGGPIAADVNNDGYDDLIAISSAGEISAVLGPNGTLAWEYDLYAAYGDYPFGHAAVDDIDGDGKYELAIGGTQRGGVYMLNAESGTVQWAVPNLYSQYQNYFYGSGPTLVNLDNDPALEVTAAMAGYPGPAAVLALDSNGTVLWRTTVSSDSLYYTSPSAADTDGDGKPEVFVQTTGGWLLKLAASNGSLLQQVSLGANSWASPGFMDNDYDGRMEIVTSTLSTVYLLDYNLTEIDRYTNTNSGLYPPPVIGDTDANGQLDLVTGAWFPKQVLSIKLPYTSAFSWSTFAGSALHGGAASTSPDSLLGDDPAPAIVVILAQVHNLVAQTNGTAQNQLTNARFDLDLAYREYLRGNPHLSVDRLRQALVHLQAVPSASYNTTPIQQRVAWVGIMIFEQYINRTQALVG
ncbi:MAG TPA: FG-GAP-like repeat-containing protein, partial [Polyangiales bacterium]|nr:FG-GAP-like repeat-containing protein [Polyangiales bacterium]